MSKKYKLSNNPDRQWDFEGWKVEAMGWGMGYQVKVRNPAGLLIFCEIVRMNELASIIGLIKSMACVPSKEVL